MLLAEAANIAEGLRNFYRFYMTDAEERSKYFRRIVDLIRQGVNNSIDDSSQLIDMYYPEYSKYQRQFVSFHELREDICKKLSISPLVWDESMAGKPVVPLLALESAEYGGQGLTVKQALNLMARIKDEGFFQIASKMNEKEALLFWAERQTNALPCQSTVSCRLSRTLLTVVHRACNPSMSCSKPCRPLKSFSACTVTHKTWRCGPCNRASLSLAPSTRRGIK